jgi:hypothetical protein
MMQAEECMAKCEQAQSAETAARATERASQAELVAAESTVHKHQHVHVRIKAALTSATVAVSEAQANLHMQQELVDRLSKKQKKIGVSVSKAETTVMQLGSGVACARKALAHNTAKRYACLRGMFAARPVKTGWDSKTAVPKAVNLVPR